MTHRQGDENEVDNVRHSNYFYETEIDNDKNLMLIKNEKGDRLSLH